MKGWLQDLLLYLRGMEGVSGSGTVLMSHKGQDSPVRLALERHTKFRDLTAARKALRTICELDRAAL